MKSLTSILLLIASLAGFCLTACAAPQNDDSQAKVSEHIKTASFEGYIFPKEHLVMGLFLKIPQENGYTLNSRQVIQAEKIIQKHKSEVLNVCPSVNLRTYKRQYFGEIDKNGDIIVHITMYERSLVEDKELAEDDVFILDGGCEIIHIDVNLSRGTILDIFNNGYA